MIITTVFGSESHACAMIMFCNMIMYLNPLVTPMDYESLDVILMFGTCQTKQCVTVTIMDDDEDEPDESFFYTLTRPPGGLDSRITLSPTLGEILIRDNDG